MTDSQFDYKNLQGDLDAGHKSQFGQHGDAGPPPPYNPGYGFLPPPLSGGHTSPQQSSQPQVVNVVTHQFSQGPSSFGLQPMRIQCPNCLQSITTNVTRKSVCKTHGWACCLFIFLCWLCVCVPYCCASCKDAYHSCPNCKTDLGVYRT